MSLAALVTSETRQNEHMTFTRRKNKDHHLGLNIFHKCRMTTKSTHAPQYYASANTIFMKTQSELWPITALLQP